MYHPVKIAKLSKAQVSKLLNGHRVRIKHHPTGHHTIHLSNEQHKKLMKAHAKGSACCCEFDPYQIAHHQHLRDECGDGISSSGRRVGARRGRGFLDFAKGAFKAVAPLAIDEGSKFLKSKIEGMGAKRRPVAHPVAHKPKVAKKHHKPKKGEGWLESLESGLIHTGIPTLGHIAGEVVGGPAGALVGEEIGNIGANALGNLVGRGMKGKRGRKGKMSCSGALLPAGY